jgi:hypothetical protein
LLLLRRKATEETPECYAPTCLLDIPDPCLLTVLQHVAATHQRSLFSAARSHSRLYSLASVAQRDIVAVFNNRWAAQQQIDSMLEYMRKYSPHIDSVALRSCPNVRDDTHLWGLPSNLQLSSLHLENLRLDELDWSLCSMLDNPAAAAAFKQLRLSNCELCSVHSYANHMDRALLQLPAWLEHLSFDSLTSGSDGVDHKGRQLRVDSACFHTDKLLRLQQLTYLELASIDVKSSDDTNLALQPLQALTCLVHLRLARVVSDDAIRARDLADVVPSDTHEIMLTASMLSGAEQKKT